MTDKNLAASQHQIYCRVDEHCHRDFQFVMWRNYLTTIDNYACLFVLGLGSFVDLSPQFIIPKTRFRKSHSLLLMYSCLVFLDKW